MVPFILVALYWGIVASFETGRMILGTIFVIWAASTIITGIARQKLNITDDSKSGSVVNIIQKISVIAYIAGMVPLFLLMDLAEKRKNKVVRLSKEETA